MNPPSIQGFGPARPWYRPGEDVIVVARVRADEPVVAHVTLTALDLDHEVASASLEQEIGLDAEQVELTLSLPSAPRRGYGLRLDVATAADPATARSAVEVLEGWWQSPRHAAVTEYADAGGAACAMRDLAGWQVNVVQHYDWMWRHYRYRPPDDAELFEDVLGRTVSHEALRASIAAGHEAGIAAMAYGAVYGAEPEHVKRHPDDRVFDEDGEPLSLGGTFYINDIRPGSAWRTRLLGEYVDGVASFGFDGIHMDTYGPPHTAVAADGEPIAFAELYPGLIEEAAAALDQAVPGTRVLFNCVEGFPLESVASAPAVALYLELWPPDDSLGDVVRWIDRARAVADGRQVVMAAYGTTLKDLEPDADRAAAFAVIPLLGSVIAAAGAYHHTLAEDDRLLVEGYYPAAVAMTAAESDELRALWRFTARYVHLLSDPRLRVDEPTGLAIRDHAGRDVPWSTEPEAGSLWIRTSMSPDGRRILHLLDLRDQPDADWTKPKRVAMPATGLRLDWEGVEAVAAMSPWTREGDATELERDGTGWALPSFRRWLVAVER